MRDADLPKLKPGQRRPKGRRMKAKHAKAKGRRLQVAVAEALAGGLGLTIEASPPTKPGVRNGAEWVPEGFRADLAVRRMGQPGPDVILLSERARRLLAFGAPPFSFECKNVEGWSLERMFSAGKLSKAVIVWYEQAARANPDRHQILVLGKNNVQPLALININTTVLPGLESYALFQGVWYLCRLEDFVAFLARTGGFAKRKAVDDQNT